ncbi:MAG TPA: MFS transporter [Armatimonadota bacterium]
MRDRRAEEALCAEDVATPPEFRFFWFSGHWPATFRALRHRNFLLFWSGQLISLIGTWMQTAVQAILVFELARKQFGPANTAFYLGLISALSSAPMLLFSLFAGVLADRMDKRRIVILTQSASGVLAFVMAVLVGTGHIQLWHVAILATLLGVVNAFDMPTRQAFVKELVMPGDLLNAIALNSSIFNGARIVGPAVAGLLIYQLHLGISGVFYANAISYIAVIAGLVAIHLVPHPAAASNANVWQHLQTGFRYVIGNPTIRIILLLMGVYSIFGFSYIVLMPVIVTDVLHQAPNWYYVLLTISGFGALVGALLLATLADRLNKGRVLRASGIVFSAGLIGFSLSHSLALSAVMLMFVSGGLVVGSASINSLIQEIVPDQLRGRVISMWTFIFAGFMPLGALYAGMVAHLTSPTFPILLGGIICVLMIGLLSLRTPWLWRLP